MLEVTAYGPPVAEEKERDGDRRADSHLGLVASGLQLTRRGEDARGAVVQFATGSTLLPQNVAEMVTNLALLARISIKSTAFFIEVILEAAKYSTGMGLGLTRRALISAVGTARAIHALKNGEEWDAKGMGKSSIRGVHALVRANQKAAFLSVLDKYTALGVYLIHHSFTLAELFAQSGFYLADQSIKAGLSAADESVRIVDGIFGSNETSRALSSFITMVRNELSGDEMLRYHTGGGIWTLAALTKALTVFAVLQNATFRRTAKTQKTRVLYDCLVLGEAETKTWRSQILGSGNFIKKELPALPGLIPPRSSSASVDSKTPRSNRLHTSSASIRSGMSSMRRSRSIFGVDEPCILDVDFEEENDSVDGEAAGDESNMLLKDLDYLVGAEEEDDLDDGAITPTRKIIASSELRLEELPTDVRATLAQANGDELERGLILHEEGVGGLRPRDIKRIVRQKGMKGGSAVYEITTETTEVIEETTTTTTKEQTISRARREGAIGPGGKTKRLPNPFGAFKQEKERMVPSLSSEDDWFAIEGQRSDAANAGIPEMPNGRSARQAVAAMSRKEAWHDPEDSRQKVQEVVRTITRRLIQRKRIVRQVQIDDAGSDEDMTDDAAGPSRLNQASKRKGSETPKSTLAEKGESSSSKTSDMAAGLQRALGRAKSSLNVKSPTRPTLTVSDLNLKTPTRATPGGKGTAGREKDLPMTPSLAAALPDISGTASIRRSKRRPRAGSISSIRSFASLSHTHVQSTTTTKSNETAQEEGPNGAPGAFPRQHLVKNLRRFMRHASAAYGQNFMRVLGIGDTQYLFADTRERSANIFAYAHHVGIPPESVLLSSYCEGASLPFHSEKMAPIVNYISRDDASKAIVLTCRGTLGLSDVLTDLTCTFVDVAVEDGNPNHTYQVHSGMLASAQRLAARGNTVLETLKAALEANPDYGLVLTGHSLGGGVACLLAMQLSSPTYVFQTRVMQDGANLASSIRHPKITTPFVTGLTSGLPPGRPIHAYAYGPPAITSPDLSRYYKGLCTSAVHSFDVVPCLSLGTLHDLKAVACSLSDEKESIMAQDIVGRVVGLYQRRKQRAREERLASSSSRPMLAGNEEAEDEEGEEADIMRPTELPSHERNLQLNIEELAQGRTKNRANEAGYKDPHYSEDEHGKMNDGSGGGGEDDQELNDWLWSLIKTMRASMDNNKLYPPGTVYLLEMQQVHVTAKMSGAQQDMFMKHGQKQGISSNRAEAARVILRLVEDVTSRFGEPIFSRSLFRDHLPTNYELVTQLLWEAIVPKEEQEQVEADEVQAASSGGPPMSR